MSNKEHLSRLATLTSERSSWDSHWRELVSNVSPRSGMLPGQTSNGSRGSKRHNAIYDGTASYALRTLAAGMMSGVTSPARPWFRLSVADPALMDVQSVKQWLHEVEEMMRSVFAQSNTYRALHTMYAELGLFGTACAIIQNDFDNVINITPLTVGEYFLSQNAKGQVDTMYREFTLTARQMADEFGEDKLSSTAKSLLKNNTATQIPIVHAVYPRHHYNKSSPKNTDMPWASLYFEKAENAGVLRESGFKRFPVMSPRWEVFGNDVYASVWPGAEALGDVKALQHQQKRKAQAIDYQTNPPLQVPSTYKENLSSRLPGGIMYFDGHGSPGNGIRSAFEVNLNIQHLMGDIQETQGRIKTAFYADLFLMMLGDQRSGVTATEVNERHEEKMLMLGPVLERLHNEMLSPLIDITFDALADAGALPPAPPEISGQSLDIQFVSVLAQAQRSIAAAGTDRIITVVGQLATIRPEVLDVLNVDKIVDEYMNIYGANPEIVLPSDQVEQIRQARAQQQQAQQMAAMAEPMAKAAGAAKTLGETDTDKVAGMLSSLTGYGT